MAILSDEFYYQPIRIDTINTRVYADLLAKEGDANGRGLLVTLTENGLMKDTTGITLILKWEHTSVGNQGLDNFEAVDPSKGLYKITYPTEMLNRGKVRAFIRIIDSGKLAGTRNIEITVDRGVGDDTAIASSDSFTALASALIEVNYWNARIDAVEADFIQRANDVEATYPQELVSLTSQLAEKIGGGVKAEPEDLSATTLGLVTGTGGPINLLSIPQDKSATWAKRTETGSFAKILLTGEVPNFNTSTGILTFPSDFRILVGTNYYSIAATTIDFSALVSTASQILILFDVSTLAFTAISPTSLTSAHDRSVIVATIKNVSGQRREPYMNCPFTVNNIPYVPDIEKMLLSKAIPLTNQITSFHVSGVLNMIQHKDSLGNTIRTDTFTFSPTAIVEERKHNLSNTKITFTTNLSTFTTEVN
jgi:hypothetical protein